MRTCGSHLLISVDNLPEFKRLLDDAQEKRQQLANALNALERFELSISFLEQNRLESHQT